MVSPFTWTCDVDGGDWGGRTDGNIGIRVGLPRILDVFHENNIKALFFISSEIAFDNTDLISMIVKQGHEIGSHGHFHIKYKDSFRAQRDREISNRILSIFSDKPLKYRSPHFYYNSEDSIYSYRQNHVSVLKQSWFGGNIPVEPIFYIHPFDIVEGANAPSLFCKLLYSNPQRVYETFIKLVSKYHGRHYLK